MNAGRGYVRAGDVADLLGVNVRTVRRWIKDGSLVSVRVGGARLIAKADLANFLQPIKPEEAFRTRAKKPFPPRRSLRRTARCSRG